MNTEIPCPTCGKPLPPDAPMGICPECLLSAGFGTITNDAHAEKLRAFQPPTPAELARHFPQLEILELLGRGGMGAVYKARQIRLDRVVALKILPPGIGDDPAFTERFEREAKALAKLHHPRIVTLYEFGEADGLFYFLMEFVDGVTLRHLLHGSRMPAPEALAIVPQICEALQFAHDRGIVHRDIKPENILLNKEGQVKIADFGVAKIVAGVCDPGGGRGESSGTGLLEVDAAGLSEAGYSDLTEAGKTMGTPSYMAPEQIAHPGAVDHRADIYALGVVFYQMLTGELPAKRIEPPSHKVQIDVRLDEVVLRALEKEPEQRYQQASIFKTQVETIASDSGGTSMPTGVDSSAEKASTEIPDFRTWSPFQSPEVREICAHMTDAEKGEVGRRATLFGLWAFVAPFLLLLVGIQSPSANVLIPVIGAVLLFYVVALWFMQRIYRRFLCATAWAREQNFTPEKLRLFSFARPVRRESASDVSSEPRFSRTAITGAAWLPWFFAVVPAFIWHESTTHEFERNGPFASALGSFVFFVFILPAFLVPFGTTILGWISVTQIRRSAGKLYGLGLAVFDGLFFPLLALDFGIAYVVNQFGMGFLGWSQNFEPAQNGQLAFVSCVLWMVTNFLIVRLVWRTLKKAETLQNSKLLPVVEQWLAIMDAGNYAQSWEAGAESFHREITREKWISESEKVRRPLGGVLSRKLISMKFSEGETRFDARFATAFHGMPKAMETLTFALENDGGWRAIGYFILPRNDARGWKIAFWFILGLSLLSTAITTVINLSLLRHTGPNSDGWQPQAMSRSPGVLARPYASIRVVEIERDRNVVVFHLVSDAGFSPHLITVSYQGTGLVRLPPGYDGSGTVKRPPGYAGSGAVKLPPGYAGSDLTGLLGPDNHDAVHPNVLKGRKSRTGPGEFRFGFVFPDANKAEMAVKQARKLYLGKANPLGEGANVLCLFNLRKNATGKDTWQTLQGTLHVSPIAAAPSASSFGPEMERVITGAIDFDSGKTDEIPESMARLEREGFDAINVWEAGNESFAIFCMGMKTKALAAEAFDETNVKQVLDALASARETEMLRPDENTPATYAFQTREGARGLLQILGTEENGVKLLYKMVRESIPPENALASAKAKINPAALLEAGTLAYQYAIDHGIAEHAPIPLEPCAPAILALRPLAVYTDRANIAIVLERWQGKESGLYISQTSSSFAVVSGGDWGFSRYEGSIYRFTRILTRPVSVSAGTPSGLLLMTEFGEFKSELAPWTVRVSAADRTMLISRPMALGSTGVTPSTWRAKQGWFVYLENEERAWAYDGELSLVLVQITPKGTTVYDNVNYPCEVPEPVRSRVSKEMEALLKNKPATPGAMIPTAGKGRLPLAFR